MIVFGSLSPWPDAPSLHMIRSTLLSSDVLSPVVDAIHGIPNLCKTLCNTEPDLYGEFDDAVSHALTQWLLNDDDQILHKSRCNALDMAITVISQVVQYVSYMQQHGGNSAHSKAIEQVSRGGGIQGLCVGLLTALAIANSRRSLDVVGPSAAFAIRLAFCAGWYIDTDLRRYAGKNAVNTLAVRWKPSTTADDIKTFYANYPQVSFHEG